MTTDLLVGVLLRSATLWRGTRVRFGEVGEDTSPGNLKRHEDKALGGANLIAEVTLQIDHLSFLHAEFGNVIGMDHHDPSLAINASVAVVEPIDRCVVLVVAPNGCHQELVSRELDLRDRVHRELCAAGCCFPLAIPCAVWKHKAIDAADSLVVVLEAGHDFLNKVPNCIVVMGQLTPRDRTVGQCVGSEQGHNRYFAL